ncbi:transcriptional regulator with XRE-family HTH domain [Nocardioides massiliensis]|uniref:Transcriptional regulator with XRE-family HTH domain n=1 Tax=Nocardioides massiliensis TaxID=1325935 RepID=A0ABT9NJ81_9ACTN|nr:hypothetical protein [Nocardioides massiliensis]MDP9820411.1 transcriptional regulator with XRE-family HTH domain [Nocardioides massiliensis]
MMAARVTCRCGWTKTYPTRSHAEFNARRHVCQRTKRVRRGTYHRRCARCFWEGTYDTAAKANHAKKKHSCAKHEQAMLRAALAEEREAAIDRTPKPCHHKEANHQHGTNAAYVLDKCRCYPCSAARAAQDDWRRRQKAYGRYTKYVPAEHVRAHVRDLMDAGMGLKRIVAVSGVSQGALWKLMYGKRQADGTQQPSRRVLRETAEKLYALDPAWTPGPLPLAPGARDHAGTPTARTHLRALVALGWSMSKLGARLGIQPTNMAPVVSGDRVLTRATVDAIEKLYAELCMTLPPETNQRERIAATRSRRLARERGWLPPLALDDDDIYQGVPA